MKSNNTKLVKTINQIVNSYLPKSKSFNFRAIVLVGAVAMPQVTAYAPQEQILPSVKPITLVASNTPEVGYLLVDQEEVPIAAQTATESARSANKPVQKDEANSASLATGVSTDRINEPKSFDLRAQYIRNYLNKYKAPLAAKAEVFVEIADKYGLDWRLLPAISVVESSGGSHIPAGSYNAWGWGNAKIRFQSWEQAIDTIGKALREKYVNRGLDTPEKMNKVYAESKVWGSNVRKAMNSISSSNTIQ